jgi:hypothetical protein
VSGGQSAQWIKGEKKLASTPGLLELFCRVQLFAKHLMGERSVLASETADPEIDSRESEAAPLFGCSGNSDP